MYLHPVEPHRRRRRAAVVNTSPSARLLDGRTRSPASRPDASQLISAVRSSLDAQLPPARRGRRAGAAEAVLRGVGCRTGLQATSGEERGGVREQRAASFHASRPSFSQVRFSVLSSPSSQTAPKMHRPRRQLVEGPRTHGLHTAAENCARRRQRDCRRTRHPPSDAQNPSTPALPAPSPRRRPYADAPTVCADPTLSLNYVEAAR